MNYRLFAAGIAAALLAGCSRGELPADGVESAPDSREARIAENLKHRIPQLRLHDVAVSELEASDIAGLERGSFTVGGQTYEFLLTPDERLLLLAMEPVDVSLTSAQIAEERAAEDAAAARAARERAGVLAEATAGQPVRGDPGAPVTIVEFSDFQCPYCRSAQPTVEQVLERYPGEVRLVYMHFPLDFHPWAGPAAIAAVCVAEQDPDAFWLLHDRYFEDQRTITPANVLEKSRDYLADTGIDLAAWSNCAADTASAAYRTAADAVARSMALGQRHGVTGTPGFFVNGIFLAGVQPLEQFESAIARARDAME